MRSPHYSRVSSAKPKFWLTQVSAAVSQAWTHAVKALGLRKRRDRFIREQVHEQIASMNLSVSLISQESYNNFILRDRGPDESQSARESRLQLEAMLEEDEALKQIRKSAGEDTESALLKYQQYIDDHPGSSLAYLCLGGDLRRLGRLEESLAAYQQGARNKYTIFSHLSIGDVLEDLGRFDDAISEYRKIINGDTSHFLYEVIVGQAYLNLGDVLRLQGKKREARAAWKKALNSGQLKEVQKEATKRLGGG